MDRCSWCNLSDEEQKWKLIENETWVVFLADKQDYIGRCVISIKRHCSSLAELTDKEWLDLKSLINKLEYTLKEVLGADLLNWSCLLNDFYKNDDPNPHLHLHVRPRYKNSLFLNGNEYVDSEFGHHYDNKRECSFTDEEIKALYLKLKDRM